MIKVNSSINLSTKLEAFTFQQAAVNAIEDKAYAAIFHEQGLGKTKIALDLALVWLQKSAVDSVIIVTKRSLLENWRDEIRNHTYLVPRTLSQDRTANFIAFNSPSKLYITHYEVVLSEKKRMELFLKTRKVGVILDESQKIKNPDAELTRSFFALRELFVRRIIASGTPVANRPYDLWSQVYFLDGGSSLGSDFIKFKEQLDLSNELVRDADQRESFEEHLGSVYDKISGFAVRETKGSAGIQLPTKIIRNNYCELEARQAEIYDAYRRDLSAAVIQNGVPILDDAEDILKRLLRLVQVASNPQLVDQTYKRDPGKVTQLLQMLYNIADDGEKAIVWTSFVANAKWLGSRLEEFGAVVVSGELSIDDRNRNIKRFKNSSDAKVLVATPGSAKEGLTLTNANHAIFFDRSFSLDDYLQAQDRIHRISQTRECFVTNLIGAGTIDEWVDILIAAKHRAAQLAQGDISLSEYRAVQSYDFGSAIQEVLNAS